MLSERIGADINIRGFNRNTALLCAALSSNEENIKFLLNKGMFLVLSNANYLTPLHISGVYDNREATKVFVERTAGLHNANKDAKPS